MSGLRDRAAVRKAIADGLRSTVLDPSGPAKSLYEYVKADLDVDLPALVVSSVGFAGSTLTVQGSRIVYYYDLMSFVPLGQAGTAYTEQDADDDLDAMADAVEAWIASNQVHRGVWDSIEQTGPSTVQKVEIGGLSLWLERTRIEVLVL